jgi:DNA-binding LacI/PurR family transcriptional regulator
MARSAAELLLRRLREDGPVSPSTSVFHSDLIIRGSVAPARKKAGA